jgi:hypothetical protein
MFLELALSLERAEGRSKPVREISGNPRDVKATPTENMLLSVALGASLTATFHGALPKVRIMRIMRPEIRCPARCA